MRSVRVNNPARRNQIMNPPPLTETFILETLRQVEDPEVGCNIVDLGLVYSVNITSDRVTVAMTLTTPGCPMHESICQGVRNVLLGLDQVVDVEVALVWDPPWDPSMMTETGRARVGVRNF
jgi:metal-sulfur cluster biosynthetic enzyme